MTGSKQQHPYPPLPSPPLPQELDYACCQSARLLVVEPWTNKATAMPVMTLESGSFFRLTNDTSSLCYDSVPEPATLDNDHHAPLLPLLDALPCRTRGNKSMPGCPPHHHPCLTTLSAQSPPPPLSAWVCDGCDSQAILNKPTKRHKSHRAAVQEERSL